jgi:hypothetical protein
MEIEALLLKTDQVLPSRNFYLYELVKKCIEDESIQNKISNNILYGEADTPDSYEELIKFNLNRVTHSIKNLYFKDKDLYGIIEILPTKIGKDLENLIKQGVNPKFTIRAVGNIDRINGVNWISDLKIITFDWIL